MNIQYVIHENRVYVLEVNPRASRTVPILSKVTRTPMVEWATKVQLGFELSDICPATGLLNEPHYYSVKAPIFSASKLKGVDHCLGPEMKSTGEILGVGLCLEEALHKALLIEGKNPLINGKKVICSIADRAKKESLSIIQELYQKNVPILATEGTANYLVSNDIQVETILDDENKLIELLKSDQISAVINIATQGRNQNKCGFRLRELALKYKIPCFTHLDTVKTMLTIKDIDTHVYTINDLWKVEVRK